jgi:arabinose-5-phosphate isomerase
MTPSFTALGAAVLDIESRAVAALIPRLDAAFERACQLMLECEGRVVVTGMGKSGHVGSKIAATLASTGTPAFFVHPGEASHGDLGMITRKDVVLALSNSGSTEEILRIVPLIRRLGAPLIALTGRPESELAQAAQAHIDVSVAEEACPLGLAPTASTTAALAMGDALAVALLKARGFTAEDFALSHPAGRLGRRLLLHLGDVMRTGDLVPRVPDHVTVAGALVEMTRKGMGLTAVMDASQRVAGIYTDGDLRRTLERQLDFHTTPITAVMTRNPRTMHPDALAADVLNLMQERKIHAVLVTDGQGTLVGVANTLDLLRAGVA